MFYFVIFKHFHFKIIVLYHEKRTPSLHLLFVNYKIPILGSKKYSTITNSRISQKIHYYKKIYLIENWSVEFCPLFWEIPLLQDTLLQESTVHTKKQAVCMLAQHWKWLDSTNRIKYYYFSYCATLHSIGFTVLEYDYISAKYSWNSSSTDSLSLSTELLCLLPPLTNNKK